MCWLSRRGNQVWAWLHGYFWAPCPLCGRMFGGHEYGEVSVPVPGFPGTGLLTCKRHHIAAIPAPGRKAS